MQPRHCPLARDAARGPDPGQPDGHRQVVLALRCLSHCCDRGQTALCSALGLGGCGRSYPRADEAVAPRMWMWAVQ